MEVMHWFEEHQIADLRLCYGAKMQNGKLVKVEAVQTKMHEMDEISKEKWKYKLKNMGKLLALR